MSKKKNQPAQEKAQSKVNTQAHGPEQASASTGSPSAASSFSMEGKYLYLLMGAVALSCFIIFRGFISSEKVYLFKDIGSDSINNYFPWLVQLAEYMKTSGVPSWTFSQGMGQNLFPLWLGDIFSNFLMLFGKQQIPYMLAYMEIAKIMLCSFVFYKYLREIKVGELAAAVTSFMFAFCGYIILGGGWFIFSVEALYVSLILLGFERWMGKGKWLWFVVGITALSFLQPFWLFLYTIFLSVYIPVRYNDVRTGQWGKFPVFVLKTAGLALLGVAISSYQLFPDLLQYIESPRVGGEARLIEKLKAQPVFGIADDLLKFTTTFRTFGSDMLGTGSNFVGWQNYLEAPLFYCGILSLVAFPQAFPSFNKQQKIAYGIIAGLFTLPIFFPFFRYCFWAFTGDYFRTFSLVITLLIIMFTARALHHIFTTGKINLVILGVTAFILLALLFSPSEQYGQYVNTGMRSAAGMLIVIYSGLLFGISRNNAMRNNLLIALLCICFGEMVYFSSTTVNDRDLMTGAEVTDKVGYNDYSVDAVKYIKDKDKSFYRVTKDYSSSLAMHTSINDAKVQGYFGTPSYFSFNQKNYIKFLADVNVLDPKDEMATRWARGLMDRPLLFTMAAGKYALTMQPSATSLIGFGYDSMAMTGNVKVFKNRYYLPLAFTYDSIIDEKDFKVLSNFQKDVSLLRGCVVSADDKDLQGLGKHFNIADTATPFNFDMYSYYVNGLRKDNFNITQFKESHIKGEITVATPKILFFSIPHDDGWHATINGNEAKIYRVNCGLMGLKLGAGNNKVELKYEVRLQKQGAMVSLLALAVFAGLLAMQYMKQKKEAATNE